MSQQLRPVRGTHDWLADDAAAYRHVVDAASSAAACYGFAPMQTPIFEFSEVFHRTLGETSDVVGKETYSFEDRGGDSLTLRPEFTAGIVRAFISNGLQEQVPFKAFYHGPAFRYERPQKGRMRQFHQLGVELLGASEVQADIEVIALAYQMLSALGLADSVTLELNSLGDAMSRATYRAALVEYFSAHKDALSQDSQTRLEKNPLRILDSKNEDDKALCQNAPKMHDAFNDASNAFFAELCAGLDALGLAYNVNDRLVRGLDYYNHTVFEFTTDKLGAQGTVLAGGRYDGLVKLMGGPETAGVGFAAGIERLVALSDFTPKPNAPIVMIPMGDGAQEASLNITHQLRTAGFLIEQGFKGNMSKRMKKADKLGACAVLLLGEDELTRGEITLRDLTSGEQQSVALTALANALEAYR
jgi:histidyl-tRNA synthetase